MLLILLPALAVILTAMPGAVVMRFFAGGNGFFLEKVSGFSRILVGYGQIFPGLAGTAACCAAIFALRGPDAKRVRSFAAAGAIFWCIAGLQSGFTIISMGAAILLAVTAGIAQLLCREEKR